jgi:hypothetical protein
LIATGFTSRAVERHFRHESVARLAVRVGRYGCCEGEV